MKSSNHFTFIHCKELGCTGRCEEFKKKYKETEKAKEIWVDAVPQYLKIQGDSFCWVVAKK